MFVAAGPLRCASGPGDPQSPSLDCVPLSTCPALEASAGRSHRQRRPGRIAGGGGVCLRWGMNSFGAVCEWGCEGSERPGLRSGSGNSESEAGSGPASPAIAGGPQPSAAKARNSLQSLPPFAGCAREPPIHPSPETPRRPPASREPPRPSPARAPSLPAARSPASREPPRRSAFREPLPPIRLPRPRAVHLPPRATAPFISLPRTASPIRLPRPRAVHLPPEQRPRSFPSREPPRRSVSRDPAPSTCLPSNGPVHFPPENRLADPPPENHSRPSASRDPAPSTCLPSNGPVHFPPENHSRRSASREPLPLAPPLDRRTVFSTNHGNRSPPARPIFAVSGPAVRRPLSGKQSLGRPLPAAARRIVGRNYCRRHSRPPASSLRRPAGIFPKPTSRIAPLAALADGSQASQAPATVTSALSEVRLKKPPVRSAALPGAFPKIVFLNPSPGRTAHSARRRRVRTAVPPYRRPRYPGLSAAALLAPLGRGYITKKAIVDRSLSVLSYQDSNLE